MDNLKLARVKWFLGQTLLPEQFVSQEQALTAEADLRTRLHGLPSFGIGPLKWNEKLLEEGVLAISVLTAVIPTDGNGQLLIDIPGNAVVQPLSLKASGATRVSVYLHILEQTTDATGVRMYEGDPKVVQRVMFRALLSIEKDIDRSIAMIKLAELQKEATGGWHWHHARRIPQESPLRIHPSECFDGENGWAINSADDDPDLGRRDSREATSLFGLLEREIVPLFYDRGYDAVPHGWVEKMEHNWRSLGPFVTAARMVRDYTTELYEPAAASSNLMRDRDGGAARELAAWKRHVLASWPSVRVVDVQCDIDPAHEGDQRRVQAIVEIDGLDVADVAVQVLHGPVDSAGEFIGAPATVALAPAGEGVFEGEYSVGDAGPYGLTVRAMPSHPHMVNPVELGLIAWAN